MQIVKQFLYGKWTVVSLLSLSRKTKYRWWGWVEDVSQSTHAYRIRAVRVMSLYFILHPPPPYTQCTTVSGTFMFIAAYTQGSVPTTKLYDHTQLAGLCSLCPLGRVTSSGSMD